MVERELSTEWGVMSAPDPPPLPSSYSAGYSAGPPPGLPTSADDTYAAGRIDSRARNALILGVIGIIPILPLGIVTGVPAIVLGGRALRRLRASNGMLKGRAAAWCAVVLGCISVVEFTTLFYSLSSLKAAARASRGLAAAPNQRSST